jgi:cell shape-determining protein MreC|tara:strand:- start:4 stop:267 length:264 start_codon:yes stop_codon:yes gene_type:complete
MLREIKYLIFIFIICLFLFFTLRYYFSDTNKKNSYRSLSSIDDKIKIYSNKLPILEDDTNNIIEYVEQTNTEKKKKFNFWKLLESNE